MMGNANPITWYVKCCTKATLVSIILNDFVWNLNWEVYIPMKNELLMKVRYYKFDLFRQVDIN